MRSEARFPELDRKAGHYESFYIKTCRPEGGLGVWIRHTVHKRRGAEPTASLWFTYTLSLHDALPIYRKSVV